MFRGFHNSVIDAKGRIKLPVRHYNQIQDMCNGKIVLTTHPEDNCLLLYPLPEWQVLERKVNSLPSLNSHSKHLKRKLIGHASDCDIDSTQRVLVPKTLRDIVFLDKMVLISGQCNKLEIWSESLWNKHLIELDKLRKKEDIPEELTKLSI